MRKHRSWWMGFGLGIVLGAMLLQLINFAMENDPSRMLSDEVRMYTQQELDEAVAEALRKAELVSAPQPSPQAGEENGGTDGKDLPPQASPAGESSDAPEAAGNAERVVAFYVNKNMSLMTVARSLKALGVIEDPDDFTQAARPYSRQIAVGTSVFAGQPTYEEIIAELMRPKDN